MTELEAKRKEFQELKATIEPLQQRREELGRKICKLESREFIKVNDITKDDVELSSGGGKPYFGHVSEFSNWLTKNSTKRFAEWNYQIHFQSDLCAGYFKPTVAKADDLK